MSLCVFQTEKVLSRVSASGALAVIVQNSVYLTSYSEYLTGFCEPVFTMMMM